MAASSAYLYDLFYTGNILLTDAPCDLADVLEMPAINHGFVGPEDAVPSDIVSAEPGTSEESTFTPVIRAHQVNWLGTHHTPALFFHSDSSASERSQKEETKFFADESHEPASEPGAEPQQYLEVVRRLCSGKPEDEAFVDEYLARIVLCDTNSISLVTPVILPLEEETNALVRMGASAVPDIVAAITRDLRWGNERATRCLVRVLARIGTEATPALPLLCGLINIYTYAPDKKELSDALIEETLKAIGSIGYLQNGSGMNAETARVVPFLMSLIEKCRFDEMANYRYVLPKKVWEEKNPRPSHFKPSYLFARRERLIIEVYMSMAELALNAILNIAPSLVDEAIEEIAAISHRYLDQIVQDSQVTYFFRKKHIAASAELKVRTEFCNWLRDRLQILRTR